MELYTIRNTSKNGKALSYILADSCEVIGDHIKYYLKGVYVESRLIVATNFSVIDLNSLSASQLEKVYTDFRQTLSDLMREHKAEKFEYACALSEATEEIWEQLKANGYTRMFIKK